MGRPNLRLQKLAWRVEHQAATLTTDAIAHLNEQLAHCDGYPAGNDNPPVSHSVNSAVEQIAARRHELTSQREQVRDDIEALETMVGDYIAFLTRIIGTRGPLPELCDGNARRYQGYMQAWQPDSKHPDNGWHDPHCRDIAGPTGLCDRCLTRCNRWRRRHGLRNLGDDVAAQTVMV